jgi:hypothetical protein
MLVALEGGRISLWGSCQKKEDLRDQDYGIQEVYKDLHEGGALVLALKPITEKEQPKASLGTIFVVLPVTICPDVLDRSRLVCITKLDSMEPIVILIAKLCS